VPCGSGTYGVDPATGKKRWEYDVPDDAAHAKGGRGLWAPYGSYAPVAWKNFVIDDVSNAHDDIDSQSWCVQILNDKPTLVWESSEFVLFTECMKSNLLIHDGKVYGFDAHGVRDEPGLSSEERVKVDKWKGQPGRNKRTCGELQCRDVTTGKLLWSADPMKYVDGHGNPGGDWYPTQSIVSGNILIAWNHSGLGVMRIKDDGVDMLARGPADSYFVWNEAGYGSEPVLVDGLLYLRKFISTSDGTRNESNLACYDMRAK